MAFKRANAKDGEKASPDAKTLKVGDDSDEDLEMSHGQGTQDPIDAQFEKFFKKTTEHMTGMMNEMKKELKGTIAQEVQHQMKDVKGTVENIKGNVEDAKKDIESMKQEIKTLKTGSSASRKDEGSTDPEMRKLEVVVGGLKDNMTAEKLITEIENELKVLLRPDHKLKVSVTKDPTNYGIIKFPNIRDKILFYKEIEKKKHITVSPNQFSYQDNKTFEERCVDKQLGYIKYHLIEDTKMESSSIKIHWDKKLVEANKKKVAWYVDGNWKYTTVANAVKDKAEKSTAIWIQRRTAQDIPTDSD